MDNKVLRFFSLFCLTVFLNLAYCSGSEIEGSEIEGSGGDVNETIFLPKETGDQFGDSTEVTNKTVLADTKTDDVPEYLWHENDNDSTYDYKENGEDYSSGTQEKEHTADDAFKFQSHDSSKINDDKKVKDINKITVTDAPPVKADSTADCVSQDAKIETSQKTFVTIGSVAIVVCAALSLYVSICVTLNRLGGQKRSAKKEKKDVEKAEKAAKKQEKSTDGDDNGDHQEETVITQPGTDTFLSAEAHVLSETPAETTDVQNEQSAAANEETSAEKNEINDAVVASDKKDPEDKSKENEACGDADNVSNKGDTKDTKEETSDGLTSLVDL